VTKVGNSKNQTKVKILVIDDQPGIRRLLTEVLQDEGYEVFSAENGYDGLQAAKEKNPAVILMDMKMPGMDGIETLRELKQIGQQDKVIMMTAYGELETVSQAAELGAYKSITKPFDIIALCQMVSERIMKNPAKELLIG
jgi:two-component system response regulator (stage 0 sporulation protein F)